MRSAAERAGREIAGEITQPHVRPWSTVFRAQARGGAVFLKCCGGSQAHEPRLTALLARYRPGDVPALLARHPKEDWMLLADGGKKVRELFAGPDLLREWTRVLPRYAALQIAMLGMEREILATGTPDARLERLDGIVLQVLDDHSVTQRQGFDHVSADDERRIRAAVPRMRERATEVAALGIGATVDHDDLHDANVLVLRRRTVIFDWGDACLAHPFLSLTIALRFAARRAGVAVDHPLIRRLRDAYLEPFERFAPAAQLRNAAAIARRLGVVTRALAWYRTVTLSEGPPDLGHETFAGWLRELPRAFPPRVH